MLFNSLEFLIFLPIIFVIYWSFFSKNIKKQNLFLLISSYVFYGWWDYRFLVLIISSTVFDYFTGIYLYNAKNKRNYYVTASVLFNLSILGFFKYYNFFIDSLYESLILLGFENVNLNTLEIILPVGISFYTFQTMSYTFDIYYKKIVATRDFIGFATFVAFFPQLVAGPIEKANKLLPQILSKRYFSYSNAKFGIFLIVIGFCKKVLIADNLAIIVDEFYSDPLNNSINTTYALIAMFFYSLQIYCDFSGYSDIAIGISKLFGIKLSDNFKRPYFSLNPVEFWRRWHISLSTWFRDYLFIPLGGSRISKIITIKNVFLVFIISGLWHGANWTFVFWGFGHFIIYMIYDFNKNILKINFHKSISLFLTFIAVSILWIPFRSSSIEESFYVIKNILNLNFLSIPFGLFSLVKMLMLILILLFIDIMIEKNIKIVYNKFFISIIICLIILFGNFFSNNFIYFQF